MIKLLEVEATSAGGIILADSAKEKPSQGVVVAVGNGKKLDNGSVQPMDVKEGDSVLFGKYAGSEVKIDGEELIVMKEDEIVGIID